MQVKITKLRHDLSKNGFEVCRVLIVAIFDSYLNLVNGVKLGNLIRYICQKVLLKYVHKIDYYIP